MPNQPDECENGERQPDPTQPCGGTAEEREHGKLIKSHNRPITAPTDPGADRSTGADR